MFVSQTRQLLKNLSHQNIQIFRKKKGSVDIFKTMISDYWNVIKRIITGDKK